MLLTNQISKCCGTTIYVVEEGKATVSYCLGCEKELKRRVLRED